VSKHLKEGGVKKIKDSMKMEDGEVHHKRYDGRCTKQQVKIPKVT
jgi:hypothetical protein